MMWTSQWRASVPLLVLLSLALLMVLQEPKAAMAQEQCGSQAGFALCGNALCCSQFGFCGDTSEYCCQGCQSQCRSDQCGSAGCSSGLASFYTAPYTPSACFGDDPNQFSQYFAAAGDGNPDIWQNGANCGKFFQITCVGNGCRGAGTISVKIVDRCPNGCSGGRAFDLSAETFNAIADPNVGVITVNYCPA